MFPLLDEIRAHAGAVDPICLLNHEFRRWTESRPSWTNKVVLDIIKQTEEQGISFLVITFRIALPFGEPAQTPPVSVTELPNATPSRSGDLDTDLAGDCFIHGKNSTQYAPIAVVAIIRSKYSLILATL